MSISHIYGYVGYSNEADKAEILCCMMMYSMYYTHTHTHSHARMQRILAKMAFVLNIARRIKQTALQNQRDITSKTWQGINSKRHMYFTLWAGHSLSTIRYVDLLSFWGHDVKQVQIERHATHTHTFIAHVAMSMHTHTHAWIIKTKQNNNNCTEKKKRKRNKHTMYND